MVLKLKHLLHCPAPLRVLTCAAFIFGSLNSVKLIIISPSLWVSESPVIVPGLSPALRLPDGGSGTRGRQGHPAQGRLLLLLDHQQASVELQALTACLQAAPPKGKSGQAGSSGAGGARLRRRIPENMLNSARHLADTHWVLLFT